MKIIKKKKLSIKKIILIILTIFVALLVLISLFAGNYLVNYSIGRSGDGGNRTVALEIPETADDTERTIAEGKLHSRKQTKHFLLKIPVRQLRSHLRMIFTAVASIIQMATPMTGSLPCMATVATTSVQPVWLSIITITIIRY